jgi:zinc/manganese transport system substrate-binding protein
MRLVRLGFVICFAIIMSCSTLLATHAQSTSLRIVATTTIIADIAQNVVGDKATVRALVPSNGDTHDYQPSTDDVKVLTEANLIFINGAGLEGFIDKLITDSGTQATQVVVSRGLPIQKFSEDPDANTTENILGISGSYLCGQPQPDQESGECDPHLWQNATNIIGYVLNIRDALSMTDPTNADVYNTNAGNYIAKLQQLDAAIFSGLASIPTDQRIFVTNHDALGYFVKRYGFKIVGVVLPGGGTNQEPTPKEIAELIDLIREKQVKVIFLENISNDKFAKDIASQAGVQIVQSLYTDALGDRGTDGETYLGMMYANLKTIQNALK